jgi:hypothetical protein
MSRRSNKSRGLRRQDGRVDLWKCLNGAKNEQWTFATVPAVIPSPTATFPSGFLKNVDSGLCLTATAPAPAGKCTNVWSRPLSNGDVALALINHGTNGSTVFWDPECFAAAGLGTAAKVAVRDLIAHADLPVLTPPFNLTATVMGAGGAAAFRLTPSKGWRRPASRSAARGCHGGPGSPCARPCGRRGVEKTKHIYV